MNLTISNYFSFEGRKRKFFIDEPARNELLNKNESSCSVELSDKSIKLIKSLDEQIEQDWTSIKKGELLKTYPHYFVKNKKNIITFKPLYGANRPKILMEIDEGKYTQRFIFDRKNPRIFKYEKTVTTDFGYATLKTFNSEAEKNSEITTLAETYIDNFIPKILTQKVLEEYYGETTGWSKPRVKVIID